MTAKKIHALNPVLLIILVIGVLSALFTQPIKADSAILKWALFDTPGQVSGKNDIVNQSEVNRFVISSDDSAAYAIDIPNANNVTGRKALYKSNDKGYSWNDDIGVNLYHAMSPAEQANFRVWNIALSPVQPQFIAVVTDNKTSNLPRNVWISTDGGNTWNDSKCPASQNISAIDIAYNGNTHIIAIGTRSGTGTGNIIILKETPLNSCWSEKQFETDRDIMALKFSPKFQGDSTIVAVYSTSNGTFLTAGIHDIISLTTNWNSIFPQSSEITTGTPGTSARANQMLSADIEMPSDFFGLSPSLRRFFISIDAPVQTAGIYRFDDSTGYWLMPATSAKRISSIAYYGTYKSGKLLAGEVLGNPCSATVMTWFTDAPMTCPIPCWYSSIKPPTGAAGATNCTGSGYGNAQVAWSADGKTAYAGTASSAPLIAGVNWPIPYLTGINLDESALSISSSNGLTWNQISLIDTKISQLTDVAPSPDRSTVYLASSNNSTNCSGFDSVWRTRSTPVASQWERVLCKTTTSDSCVSSQTDNGILRLAGDKANGQAIVWAAVGSKLVLYSTNYGDAWNNVNPKSNVQDIAFEDSSTMYILSSTGQVQQFTSKGSGWISTRMISTGLDSAYSIASAYTGLTPDNDRGNIIVGSAGIGDLDIAFSTDAGKTFTTINKRLPTRDKTMVIASSSYKSDGYIIAFNSGGMYAWGIYSGDNNWETWWGGEQYPSPVTGLSISRNYGFYLSAPSNLWGPATPYVRWSAALSGLDPLISLGTQPTTRLRICGGLEYGQPITVYAIDQRAYSLTQGGVWHYTDCLSWEGPAPVEPVSLNPVNFDPVSGRASEINLKWKPVCLSRGYQIQIAKDIDFNMLVADIGNEWGTYYTPYDLDKPALVIPAGGGTIFDFNGKTWTMPFLELESGHTYYWKVRARDVATGDSINSPWSWRESFIIRQGFRVISPNSGPQLLSPDNKYCCYFNNPVCFSWTTFPGATGYRFELSSYPDMSSPLIATEVPGSVYQYEGNMKINTNYFWRVRAEKPQPSEWSSTFTFSTKTPETSIPMNSLSVTPLWVWVVLLAELVSILTVLIMLFYRRHLE